MNLLSKWSHLTHDSYEEDDITEWLEEMLKVYFLSLGRHNENRVAHANVCTVS